MTVGQVNINTPARHLIGEFKTELDRIFFQSDKDVIISYVMGDSEAKQFAYEIKVYLDEHGYIVKDFRASIFDKPINGWGTGPEENGSIKLIIGSNLK